jgi:hypothetical protein
LGSWDLRKAVAQYGSQLGEAFIQLRRDWHNQTATMVSTGTTDGSRLAIASLEERKAMTALGVQLGDAFVQMRRDYQGNKWKLLGQAIDETSKAMITRIEYKRALAAVGIETYRLATIALSEESGKNLEIEVSDSKWDLDMFQYGANMLAAVGGGVAGTQQRSLSQLQTALGGGLSGAAAGAMIGAESNNAGYGAAIGGALGIASSFLQ